MDSDFCDAEGARRLKQHIEDYWREQGLVVEVKLVEAPFVAAMRSARIDVRSDMLNGLPRRVLPRNHRVGGLDDIEL